MNKLRPATGRAFGMKAKESRRDDGLQVAPSFPNTSVETTPALPQKDPS